MSGEIIRDPVAMSRADVLARIQAVVRAQLEDASLVLSESTVAGEMSGWDSVAHVQIIVAVENDLGVLFDPDEYMDFDDVADMVSCIMQKLAPAVR